MSVRTSNKFDFLFSDNAEKRKFYGLMALYLEDMMGDFQQEIESDNARRMNFKKLGTRIKNSVYNWVTDKFYDDLRFIKQEMDKLK